MEALETLQALGVAVALGLLIGVERGWKERGAGEGQTFAGLRTFGLIGLLGGLVALLARASEEPLLLGFGALALGILVVAGYRARSDQGHMGATTEVAALLTFALGAAPMYGHGGEAAAGAVVTVVLLGLKRPLHRGVEGLTEEELHSAFKLLFLALVLLPVVPDRPLGPWGTLNPRQMIWMVVLIGAISFAGWFALRLGGARRGVALTAFLGGIVSSTAVTLHLSRLAGRAGAPHRLLAAGIVLANATMFLRVVVETAIVNPALLPALAPALGAATATALVGAAWLWRRRQAEREEKPPESPKPIDLRAAVLFAALLATVMLLSEWLRREVGEAGVYALAAAAGLADVDAITLSLANGARDGLAERVAVTGILIAVGVNTAVKAALALAIGGRATGVRVAAVLGAAMAAAAAALVLV